MTNNIPSSSVNPMISLYQNKQVVFANSIFTCNYNLGSDLILIDLSYYSLPVNSTATYEIITNINIYNNSFFNNAALSIITVTMNQDCLNINIDNNTFDANAGSGNLLQLTYTGTLPAVCIYGGDIQENDGGNQIISIPPRQLNITNLMFHNNYQAIVINVNNLANLYLNNLIFKNNGQFLDSNIITTAKIKTYPGAYLFLDIKSIPVACINLITLSSIYSLEFISNTFTSNYCALLSITSMHNLLIFDSLTIENNKISSASDFITISSSISTALNNLTFINNTSTNPNNQILSLALTSASGNYTITNNYFYNCSNGIKANSIDNLIISNLTVSNDQAQVYSSLYIIAGISSTLSIMDSNFTNSNSTVILISSDLIGSNLDLQANNLLFSNNNSTESLINIDNKVTFSIASSINNSIFTYNSARILTLQSSGGLLSFNDCYFGNNTFLIGTIAEMTEDANLKMKDCIIEYKKGEYLTYLLTNTNSSVLETINCNFSNNQGAIVYSSMTTYRDFNSIFSKNAAGTHSLIFISGTSSAILTNTSILSNNMTSNGPLYITEGSSAEIISSTFDNNTVAAKGGAIFSDQNSIFIIKNSIFTLNSATQGSAIYLQHSTSLSEIHDSSFLQNSASSTGCISSLNAFLLINSSYFSNNTGSYNSAIEILYYSTVNIQNTTFNNHSGEAAHLDVDENCKGYVNNSYFNNSYSLTGCSVAKAYQGTMIIENSLIENADS